jgi:hypothetical protein
MRAPAEYVRHGSSVGDVVDAHVVDHGSSVVTVAAGDGSCDVRLTALP